ncbi:uracil-DNA glycosylase [Deinococcus hopiensis]|uniref:Type-4 uracil-DNA glycosylase n=1 Tax=Deinococcus hopiensis KR-140 TaxID=695939 RepID=A0A1W1VF58_9DEIO|nr:uracil-DNA glycosylase [Deinococcus hopiensis]SMB91992.1 DNA polymerase [Deinococcus hopiensis KR-140]
MSVAEADARPTALSTLEEQARTCTACRLRPGCSGVVAAGGRPDAPLLIVGEAPGGDEDRLGHPFAGPAGQMLDRILAAVELTREEVHLTSLVQCRPPGDRAPWGDEVEACTRLWLRPRLNLLRPRVVLTLGNAPAQFLLGTRQGITRLRGTWFPFSCGDGAHGALLMPLFHPAYLLRHESRAVGGPRSLTWRDIREVAAVLRGEKEPEGLRPGPPVPVGNQPLLF